MNTAIPTTNDRLNAILEYLLSKKIVHNQQHFSELIGYSRTTVSLAKNSKIPVPLQLLLTVYETFPNTFSLDYLTLGKGNMLQQEEKTTKDDTQELNKINTMLEELDDSIKRNKEISSKLDALLKRMEELEKEL